jgi:hypothetical protein
MALQINQSLLLILAAAFLMSLLHLGCGGEKEGTPKIKDGTTDARLKDKSPAKASNPAGAAE